MAGDTTLLLMEFYSGKQKVLFLLVKFLQMTDVHSVQVCLSPCAMSECASHNFLKMSRFGVTNFPSGLAIFPCCRVYFLRSSIAATLVVDNPSMSLEFSAVSRTCFHSTIDFMIYIYKDS